MTWLIDRIAPTTIQRIAPEEASPPWKRATAAAHVRRGAPRPKIGYKNRPGPRSVARWYSAIARSPIFLRAGSWVIALSRLAPASSPFTITAAARRATSRVDAIGRRHRVQDLSLQAGRSVHREFDRRRLRRSAIAVTRVVAAS